jgi:hypothetical protein
MIRWREEESYLCLVSSTDTTWFQWVARIRSRRAIGHRTPRYAARANSKVYPKERSRASGLIKLDRAAHDWEQPLDHL